MLSTWQFRPIWPHSDKDFPPCVPFHVGLSRDLDIPVSTISFNPILMAPPTDYSTIYTTLVHSKEIANIHGHISIPAFFDMWAWACPDELAGVLPCEGGMHLMIAVMAGKLYGEAGLQDLLQESGVFAAGTMQQILNGKDFVRGL